MWVELRVFCRLPQLGLSLPMRGDIAASGSADIFNSLSSSCAQFKFLNNGQFFRKFQLFALRIIA
jgi:hypothetical protein